ncbi:MAG: tetratricopeptide repeat protein [Candidatus Latescibacteria bacterium]|nr:tetratricopeptide repeat protein [Candidatus Latescibacterota bacterium]NIM66420.1 tetratricopeptide repeat protein [Candidatus Latescibacterota bacterium]NIO02899.1 tetratricopeptide repeat protein [Candidatus Latescibacterota bacterium]NIO30034.1 tetratricopeptide repeat protein [Candidatus Latescibacterota bacterium]NIO57649.1 tetratricopeptide repeat protein [Candidatus Latescibacterota bacterium]
MKALFYTLLLSALLVGAIFILRSIEEREGPSPRRLISHPVVSSEPAPMGTFDLKGTEAVETGEIYATGAILMDLWHVKEAMETFEEAARRDSSYLDVYIRLVECYSHPLICREDKAKSSWSCAQRIAAMEGLEDTLFVSALGSLYLEADFESAAEGFERFITTPDREDDSRYFLATALFHLGRLDEAERHLRKLLEKDESSGKAREFLVRCAAARGDLEEARARAKELAALYSEEPFPYVLLSQTEMLGRDFEEALSFCNSALAIDPKYIPAILCKGNLFAIQGKREAARATFEKLLLFDDPILVSIGSESIAFVDFLWGQFDDGGDMMDDAIRSAMLAGSVRRGLFYALRLVEYFCQLGRGDKAEAIVERWFSGFGAIPARLGTLRLDICNGDLLSARHLLEEMTGKLEWRSWMRLLGLDYEKVVALAHIKNQEYVRALELLDGGGAVVMVDEERSYLRGYAAFESGEAELAAAAFREVLAYPRGLEFPYHHDPVLHVQALFYLAETEIARGDQREAAKHYAAFLEHWGEAEWDMQAVDRAREKLNTLSNTFEGGQP